MKCTHPDHRKGRFGSATLNASIAGQTLLALDGAMHAAPVVFAAINHAHKHDHAHEIVALPGTPLEALPQGYTVVEYQPDHQHHNHDHGISELGWAGLSAGILGYMWLERRFDKRRRQKHDSLKQENDTLRSLVDAYREKHGEVVVNHSSGETNYARTAASAAALGALAGQTAHVLAHVGVAGALMAGASSVDASDYVVAGLALVPLAGMGAHMFTHRTTQKHYRGVQEENARLRSEFDAYQNAHGPLASSVKKEHTVLAPAEVSRA